MRQFVRHCQQHILLYLRRLCTRGDANARIDLPLSRFAGVKYAIVNMPVVGMIKCFLRNEADIDSDRKKIFSPQPVGERLAGVPFRLGQSREKFQPKPADGAVKILLFLLFSDPHYRFSNCDFGTPQTGQTQSSGSSSKGVAPLYT